MAGTVSYMLAMLAMACGLVVLMFGFSSMHGSLYNLQSWVDEQDKLLHRTEKQQRDTDKELLEWKQMVKELTANSKKMEDMLAKTSEAYEQSKKDYSLLQQGLQSLTSKESADAAVHDEVRGHMLAFDSNMTQVQASLRVIQDALSEMSSQQRAWGDQVTAWREQEQEFETETKDAQQELRQQLGKLGAAVRAAAAREVAAAQPLGKAARSNTSDSKGEARDLSLLGPSLDAKLKGHPLRQLNPAPAAIEEAANETSESAAAAHIKAPTRKPQSSSSDLSTPSTDPPRHAVLLMPNHPGGSTTEPGAKASTQKRKKKRSRSSRAQSSTQPAEELPAAAAIRRDVDISWYRECGCTGMEIEAVTLLVGLSETLGAGNVKTNKCENSCVWPEEISAIIQKIEVPEEDLVLSVVQAGKSDGPPATPVVIVIHAAFRGVCGVPELYDNSDPRRMRTLQEVLEQSKGKVLRVSRSMLETDRLDADAVHRCNSIFDAVWVPTQFNLGTFTNSHVQSALLHTLPEAIDPALYNCNHRQQPPPTFGVRLLDEFLAEGFTGDGTFTFLSVFKWEERKNWRTLLTTFLRAFPHNRTLVHYEDNTTANVTVRLLIKSQKLAWSTDPQENLQDLLGSMGLHRDEIAHRLLIFTEALPLAMLPSLYRVADSFVLPSHGEGWGLPLMEAMACGLPTIGTGWGGNTEFMNSGNSFLLKYELVEQRTLQDAWLADGETAGNQHKWAEPDTASLQKAMWDVLRRTSAARAVSERACLEVPGDKFTPEAVARRVLELSAMAPVAPVASDAIVQ